MARAEWNIAQDIPDVVTGSVTEDLDDEHGPHTFLYVPDLTEATGWSSHRVPESRVPRRRQQVGFRRRER